ncbi:MAG: hypothetical protein JXQ90_23935 [Cyclobacteriaceae bacterium]
MKGKILFQESQRFTGTWSWYLILGVSIWMTWLFGRGFYHQIILGEPWGNNPAPDGVLISVSLFTMLITWGIFIVLTVGHLMIKIDAGTILYSYYPIVKQKTLTVHDISKMIVKKYNPILEYGGWGYRWRGKKKALNVRGKWGLEIKLATGRTLMLGTQKPKELDQAIDQLKENWSREDG